MTTWPLDTAETEDIRPGDLIHVYVDALMSDERAYVVEVLERGGHKQLLLDIDGYEYMALRNLPTGSGIVWQAWEC